LGGDGPSGFFAVGAGGGGTAFGNRMMTGDHAIVLCAWRLEVFGVD
jgi:hypothetical protein